VTAATAALGVTRKALSDLLNRHTGVSPDLAIRLEKVFGSTADTWLRMQMQRDLWEARQRADSALPRQHFARRDARNMGRGGDGQLIGFIPALVRS
jgi:addiction module HigA family antidote